MTMDGRPEIDPVKAPGRGARRPGAGARCLLAALAFVPGLVMAAPPAAPTLVSPSTSAGLTPTFRWSAADTATWYHLWVENEHSGEQPASPAVFRRWYTAADANCTPRDGCSVTASRALGGRSMIWWVQGWNRDGSGAWSRPLSYDTGYEGTPAATLAVSPVEGATGDASPRMTWESRTNVDWYRLWIEDGSGLGQPRLSEWYRAAALGCGQGGACSVQGPAGLSGEVSWWVQTYASSRDAALYGNWSPRARFLASAEAVVRYTDRATLARAAGDGLVTVGFDDVDAGTVLAGGEFDGLTLGARRLNVVAPADLSPGLITGDDNVESPPNGLSVSLAYDARNRVVFDDGDDDVRIDLARPARFAGLWVGNVGASDNDTRTRTTVRFDDEAGLPLATFSLGQDSEDIIGSGANNRVFAGVQAAAGVASIEVTNAAADRDGIYLDDIQFDVR